MTLYIGEHAKDLPAYYRVFSNPTLIAGGAVSVSKVENVDTGEVFRCHTLEISDRSMDRKDLYEVNWHIRDLSDRREQI